MSPAFLYFDLGNVLLYFSHRRAAAQMAKVAGVDEERVWQLIFAAQGEQRCLEDRCERGELDARGLYDIFCSELGVQPDLAALEHAGSDIFDCNFSMIPLLAQLKLAGHRLGILSNTSASHWQHVTRERFEVLNWFFERIVLSYQVGSMKPDAKIYEFAAEQAGMPPEQIFFVDDRPENVAGARAAGIDAVIYESTSQLARDLMQRGIRCNW